MGSWISVERAINLSCLVPNPQNIRKAAQVLRAGGLVAFPTETVYGLGADARNDMAVRAIFQVKRRPSHDPLIVHILNFEALESVARVDSAALREKLEKLSSFWPGPLSVVVPKLPHISSIVSAGLDSLAVRIPSHPVAQALLKECAFPIAAPSANMFNYVSPTTAKHVEEGLGDKVEIILDGGPSEIGLESTILSLLEDKPRLLRPGAVTLEQLEQTLGCKIEIAPHKNIIAPGLLESHYAPRTPIAFRDSLQLELLPTKAGLISFSETDATDTATRYSVVHTLSLRGDLEQVAAQLFSAIREQDKLGLELIVVDSCETSGIGRAIMDRLTRATAKF